MSRPTFSDVQEAASRIRGHIHRTPVLTCSSLDSMTGAALYFKCENLQKAGAFKYRGACNAVLALSEKQARRGVLTHSSGNHGAALALAARTRGIPATIVVPRNAPSVKCRAIEEYEARIIYCEPTLESRETTAARILDETGATLIHSYDNDLIITGQATAALELLEEVPDLDLVITPVGGGGLLSGTAIAVTGISTRVRVIAAEPEGADDAYRSFQAGKLFPQTDPRTVADGLRTSLCPRTFAVIRQLVQDIVTVDDTSIISAMRQVWERMKIVIEPSAAVPVAALLDCKIDARGKRVGVILSGGNLDLDTLPWIG